jgi:hypothetical protein
VRGHLIKEKPLMQCASDRRVLLEVWCTSHLHWSTSMKKVQLRDESRHMDPTARGLRRRSWRCAVTLKIEKGAFYTGVVEVPEVVRAIILRHVRNPVSKIYIFEYKMTVRCWSAGALHACLAFGLCRGLTWADTEWAVYNGLSEIYDCSAGFEDLCQGFITQGNMFKIRTSHGLHAEHATDIPGTRSHRVEHLGTF